MKCLPLSFVFFLEWWLVLCRCEQPPPHPNSTPEDSRRRVTSQRRWRSHLCDPGNNKITVNCCHKWLTAWRELMCSKLKSAWPNKTSSDASVCLPALLYKGGDGSRYWDKDRAFIIFSSLGHPVVGALFPTWTFHHIFHSCLKIWLLWAANMSTLKKRKRRTMSCQKMARFFMFVHFLFR